VAWTQGSGQTGSDGGDRGAGGGIAARCARLRCRTATSDTRSLRRGVVWLHLVGALLGVGQTHHGEQPSEKAGDQVPSEHDRRLLLHRQRSVNGGAGVGTTVDAPFVDAPLTPV